MIKFSTVLKTEFDEAKRRLIQVLGMGKSDVQTPFEAMPAGDDSPPIKGLAALHVKTGMNGETAIVGYINLEQLAEPGEKRLYSTDSQGNEKAKIWFRTNGNLELNGNVDNAVRFSKLDLGFNTLKNELNAFISIFNTHFHVSAAPGVPTAPTLTPATPATATITSAKIDEIKTN